MSTQRRDCPWWYQARMDCAEALWQICLASLALFFHVCTSGRTAPPDFPARLATNSPHSDRRNSSFVRLLLTDLRRGSPPPGAMPTSAAGTLPSRALSLLSFPPPALAECFRPVLP